MIISSSDRERPASADISSDQASFQVSQRVNGSGAAVLTDDQQQTHYQTAGHLQIAGDIAQLASAEMPDSARNMPQSDNWWNWTAALLAAKGAEGWLETFIARLVQEGVLALSGHPDHPTKVSDSALAAQAAVNISMGTLAAARAALHCWRGVNNPQAYLSGLRGEHAAPAPAVFIAGTPQQPAGQMAKIAATATAALATFAVASHSGWVALSHLGHTSAGKDQAYQVVTASNANTSYVWTRELMHCLLQRLGLVSHHAQVTPRGAAASSAQYLANSLLQQVTSSALHINKGGEFDLRWPILSAAAEAIDVSFITGAARFAEPQVPVTFFNHRWQENDSAEQPQHVDHLLSLRTFDLISQRSTGRHMVTEMARIMPYEVGLALRNTYGDGAPAFAAWAGAVAGSATHLREPLWQAENAASRVQPNPV